MPELPDVEGFRHILAGNALHKTIDHVILHDDRILGGDSARAFASRLRSAQLVAVRRHGKYLLAELDRGGWLILHFGMTGALHFISDAAEEPRFTRLRLDFAKDGSLAYTNKRMIGRVFFVDNAADFIAREKLGPDALDPYVDLQTFMKMTAGIKRSVKSVLMDQHIIAGIGNIYSDEILFQARIDPVTHMDALTPSEVKELFLQMRNVLKTAVAHGAGAEAFTEHMPKGSLLPERKSGGHCPRCRCLLKALKVDGRSAYCCPNCQNC